LVVYRVEGLGNDDASSYQVTGQLGHILHDISCTLNCSFFVVYVSTGFIRRVICGCTANSVALPTTIKNRMRYVLHPGALVLTPSNFHIFSEETQLVQRVGPEHDKPALPTL
jgi:hypothetical protein